MARMSDRGGQATALRWPGRRASLPVARGPVPRKATKKRLGTRSARACPSHASQKPLRLIKVLSDLCIVFLLMSIDIKVFQTFGRMPERPPS